MCQKINVNYLTRITGALHEDCVGEIGVGFNVSFFNFFTVIEKKNI
jgi:hypothetical protein